MKNKSETVTILCDYVITCAFHKLTCRQNIPRKNEKYFYFSLTLKDTEIFPKLLF